MFSLPPLIESLSMNQSLFALIKIRHAERTLRTDEPNLPAVRDGSNNKGVMDNCFHKPQSNTKLNECKGVIYA
jgi:hypothetical protein